MGQLQTKEQKHAHIRKIIDRVFVNFTAGTGEDRISKPELYTAVLVVYNDINKKIPGPHRDPPSREEVYALLEEHDTNKNGYLDREEFAAFLQKFTKTVVTGVTTGLLVYAAAPLLAMLAKRATESLPRVGPVVQRIPNFFYATVVTTAVTILHHQKTLES
ncbi:unnamed protein product [Calypogeia fissa]